MKSLPKSKWLLKVFKRRTFLQHLQLQFPIGMLQLHAERMGPPQVGTTLEWKKPQHTYDVLCGMLLEDGRFGFLLKREQQDLRYLIEHRKKIFGSHYFVSFEKEIFKKMMHDIALGMD